MKCMRVLVSSLVFATFSPVSILASPLTDRGLRLSLNAAGLDILAKEIKENALEPVKDARLPDVNEKVDYGIRVEAKDLKYSVDFTHLRVFPQQGSLGLELGVKNIKIDIPRLRASKKVIVNLATTCKNTQIKIAQSKTLNLSASLPLWVEQDDIKTKIDQIHFEIPDDQYRVIGPASCSGKLGIGDLIRSIARDVLKRSKQTIIDAVKRNVNKAEKGLEDELNKVAHQTLDLRGSVLPGLPKIDLSLKVSPFQVVIDGQRLGIEFAIDAGKRLKQFQTAGGMQTWPSWSEQHLGALGVNPDLLNEAIADWLERHPDGFNLSATDLPALKSFLKKELAVNAWPNLAYMDTSSNDLSLKLTFRKPPRIIFDEASNNLHIIANLLLTFGVELNGEWVDYYHLNLDLAAFAFLSLNGDLLEIGFVDVPNADWDGYFAEGFNNGLEIARREVLNVMVHGVMQGLYEEGAFLSLWLPTLYLGGKYVRGASLYYDSPYISAGLQASDEP